MGISSKVYPKYILLPFTLVNRSPSVKKHVYNINSNYREFQVGIFINVHKRFMIVVKVSIHPNNFTIRVQGGLVVL